MDAVQEEIQLTPQVVQEDLLHHPAASDELIQYLMMLN
jgi:hypothetical protein